QLDGPRHLATAEALDALAGHQQRLVHVVVGDGANASAVHAGERDRGRFRHRVADGVGVTDALALDHLDPPLGDRRAPDGLDHEAHGSLYHSRVLTGSSSARYDRAAAAWASGLP